MRLILPLLLGLVATFPVADKPALPVSAPRSPAEALKTFHGQRGFRLELIAHEPLVTSPVVLEYDERGRGWVLEMRDYPYADPAEDEAFAERKGDKPLGRVRVLEDTDDDGVFDKSTVFAENLSWPTGLAFWKGGVFVAATPDLWYLKDTDGDGRADLRERVYSGFRKFNIQAVINNLKWGLDHRIYAAGGANGGKIVNLKDPEAAAVTLSANDFRFDPATLALEPLAGGARFGNTFDDWGNRFICNIRNPAIHVVLPSGYLARNPFAAAAKAVHDVAEAGDTLPVYRLSPPEPWRALRAERWMREAGQTYPRSELVADGYFTSACGITVYRGDAYPAPYRGNFFIAEVSANLIHRQIVQPDGVTFTARRAEQKAEFLASTDNWFRPVNFVNAPDGTLHVVDMYRETIEHPWSIPDDIHAALDLRSGSERGRLYRLAPPGFKPRAAPRLGDATTAELVKLLEHANAWHRETAQRLIFERQDKAAVPALRRMLSGSREPLGRLHALWSLAGLRALTEEDLLKALGDAAAGVREHAIQLSEPRLPSSALLAERVVALARHEAPRVRLQAAFSLGVVPGDAGVRALAALARRDAGDPWVRAAVLSSCADRSGKLLQLLTGDREFVAHDAGRQLLRQLAQVVGIRAHEPELTAVLGEIAAADALARSEIIYGLGKGLKTKGIGLADAARRLQPASAPIVTALLDDAAQDASVAVLAVERRVQAVQLLSFATFERAKGALAAGLDARQPHALQLAALRTLAEFKDAQVATILLDHYRALTPPLRAEAIEALLARPERLGSLLTALETKKVAAADVPALRKGLLMRHANAAIRARALALFKSETPSPRRDVLIQYQPCLKLPGDAKRGKLVFERECASCHRFAGAGQEVGPDLETIRHHPPEQVLGNILDPNREVSPNYLEYLVTTIDGKAATGRIAAETATSLTLQRSGNVQEVILRTNIEEIAAAGRSLMPEGLEKKIAPQEMADLLRYLLGR